MQISIFTSKIKKGEYICSSILNFYFNTFHFISFGHSYFVFYLYLDRLLWYNELVFVCILNITYECLLRINCCWGNYELSKICQYFSQKCLCYMCRVELQKLFQEIC